ncbi:beta-L-arabinofuranosidase domain-containing protein [Pedobacter jamesrossensis]|uniref:Beta-L-arabinofuranosidase domain-containing protein n=1 Tax=Pedobacter jamesrossensis TaxID=1908238 RepID=A0ABV8NPA3_9SPHI
MKKLIILFLLCSFSKLYAQISLSGKWSYSFIDDDHYAQPLFDDSKWNTKEGNALKWTNDLPKTSNIIWIRKKILIPSTLKKELEKTGALMLYLGRIKQEDKFYFNGYVAGETNSGDIKRAYILKPEQILWDKENIIAVRISHWGGSSSVESTPSIESAKLENILLLKTSAYGVTNKDQVKNKKATYRLSIKNFSDKTLSADLTSSFYDLNQKKLASFAKKISVKPGDNINSFPYQSPSNFIKIQYNLTVSQYNFKTHWNDEYGYENINYQSAMPAVADKVKEIFSPAQLGQQNIQGWLGERLKANKEQRLYKVDEAGILAGFINKPGVHPWIGEHVGKFLEAACNAYDNTKDPALKIQLDRTAQQLISAQLNDGYLGTYEKDSQWTSWDVWSHKYDLVGLLSYYQLTGYKPALLASAKIGDLLSKRFGDQAGQLDIIKSGAHVGMAATSIVDPMTDLYRYTGKKEFLDFCYYITRSYDTKNGPRIIETLNTVGRVDKTANAKAYEMMSNLVGLVKLYRVTADNQFLKPILTAWKDITEKRLYITGTTSSFEHFHDDYLLPASSKDNMGEGCVTTTWVQLNFQLLSIFGETKYIDELERAVYNHLTGAENPQTGCVSYYTPLMGAKPYGCSITCCMSSIPRGIAMIPLFTNGKLNGHPVFYFYQPGVYKTVLGGKTAVEFATKTTFPENGNVSITVNPTSKQIFEVLLRKPYWAAAFRIAVNGKVQNTTSNDMISLNREWTKGDKIELSFELPIKVLIGGISYPNSIAYQRGPQVLAFDRYLNQNITEDFTVGDENGALIQMPTETLPKNWVGTQAYQVKASVNGKAENIILVPYADASQTGGEVSTWIKSIK